MTKNSFLVTRFLVGAEGVEPPTLASQRLSFHPQSLRDSPEGHADVVFDAIGHLRPCVSSKLQSSDARLMPLGSRGSGVRGRVYEKKRSSFLNRFWWEQRESNPRPSACKADALNQLSYAPFSFLFVGYCVVSPLQSVITKR